MVYVIIMHDGDKNMKYLKLKTTLPMLICLLILIGAVFMWWKFIYAQKPFYKPSEINQSGLRQYVWNKYGYSFLYTDNYVLYGHAPDPVPPGDDSFYFHPNGKNEPLLQSAISIDRLGERKNQTLEEFIKQYYEKWLAYSHIVGKFQPSESAEVVKVQNYPFVTPHGINGFESYFTLEKWEDANPSKRSHFNSGPFVTFEFVDVNKVPQVFRITGGDIFEGRDAITIFLNSLKKY